MVRAIRSKRRRCAFRPVIGAEDGVATGSRFGGTPWLARGEPWPACGLCRQPMQLLLQLEADTLPREVRDEVGAGLIQLFYCTNRDPHCESECEAWAPFGRSVLARRVTPTSPPNTRARPPKGAFPAARIVSWRRFADTPRAPKEKDKLFGFPYWVQGPEYPHCPDCGDEMRLVMQLDSDDHLPYSFGDAGCGHLTQCAEHGDRLAFGWACG